MIVQGNYFVTNTLQVLSSAVPLQPDQDRSWEYFEVLPASTTSTTYILYGTFRVIDVYAYYLTRLLLTLGRERRKVEGSRIKI